VFNGGHGHAKQAEANGALARFPKHPAARTGTQHASQNFLRIEHRFTPMPMQTFARQQISARCSGFSKPQMLTLKTWYEASQY
jgi:hypothetical protein